MSARYDIALQVFGMLLRAYPASFRARYAREMTQLFLDRRRVEKAHGARFWAELICDVVRTAPALHTEVMRQTSDPQRDIQEGTMRPMAILAVLVGGLEMLNALVEVRAGGNAFWRDGGELSAVLLVVLAGAMLLVAGIALLRRDRRAATWARVAAIACLAVVIGIRFVQPWMSMLSTLLGIAFPLALLAYLYVTRRDGPASPLTA